MRDLYIHQVYCSSSHKRAKTGNQPRWLDKEDVVGPAAQHYKLSLCLWYQHPVWMMAQIPNAPILIKFPSYGLGKQKRMAQVLRPLHSHGTPEEASGFQFQIGLIRTILAIWRANQQMKTRSLSLISLSFLPCITLPAYQIKINLFLKENKVHTHNGLLLKHRK